MPLAMDNECAIVILSCDKYSDLWEPFFFLFWKNWKDCPYPIYLGSNSIGYDDNRVSTIFAEEDPNWSSTCKRILNDVPYKHIFLWLEDLFVIEPVHTERFRDAVKFMKMVGAKHIHARSLPAPDSIDERGFGIYQKGMPYRVNVAGLWEKEYLVNLLIDGEDPWRFEIMGSYRSAFDDGFYCADPPLLTWLNTVEKGFLLRHAVKYCRRYNVKINNSRKMMSMGNHIKSRIKMSYFDTMTKMPWKLRIKLMDILRKALITY